VTIPWDAELTSIGVASLRVVALFAVAPLFGHAAVPPRVRVAMALPLAVVIGPHASSELAAPESGALGLAGAVIGELLVGAMLGFAVRLIFAALDVFGEIVSIQGGLGAAQILNPASGLSSAALGSMFGVIGLGTWLAINGHHDLLRALVASYQTFPVGGGPGTDSFLGVVALAAPTFALGLQLALPVSVAMIVSNAAVGILGRVMPQLNLITLQLPAQIALALLILSLSAPEIVDVVENEMTTWSDRSLAAMSGDE
jgi:flagellar biosynthetic protein FliR